MENQESGQAIVNRRYGGYYFVLIDDGTELPCKLKGSLKKDRRTTSLVVVGDKVEFRYTDENREEGLIEAVLERKSELRRAKGFHHKRSGKSSRSGQTLIANLDQVLLTIPVREPDLHPLLLDRFLVMVEHMELKPVLLLQKWDLLETDIEREEMDQLKLDYESLGYEVLALSVEEGLGVETLREMVTDKLSFLMGPSGAGKSSLVQRLSPELDIRIGEWSDRCKSGPQTTTATQIYPLFDSALLADTAGFSQVFLKHIPRDELRLCFPELQALLHECEYRDCLHEEEEGCAKSLVLEKGEFFQNRYERYRKLLEECDESY